MANHGRDILFQILHYYDDNVIEKLGIFLADAMCDVKEVIKTRLDSATAEYSYTFAEMLDAEPILLGYMRWGYQHPVYVKAAVFAAVVLSPAMRILLLSHTPLHKMLDVLPPSRPIQTHPDGLASLIIPSREFCKAIFEPNPEDDPIRVCDDFLACVSLVINAFAFTPELSTDHTESLKTHQHLSIRRGQK
jgi:hypothetical protein